MVHDITLIHHKLPCHFKANSRFHFYLKLQSYESNDTAIYLLYLMDG